MCTWNDRRVNRDYKSRITTPANMISQRIHSPLAGAVELRRDGGSGWWEWMVGVPGAGATAIKRNSVHFSEPHSQVPKINNSHSLFPFFVTFITPALWSSPHSLCCLPTSLIFHQYFHYSFNIYFKSTFIFLKVCLFQVISTPNVEPKLTTLRSRVMHTSNGAGQAPHNLCFNTICHLKSSWV